MGAKTATLGRAKPSRLATQTALRIISTLRVTSGLMLTAGSAMNISRRSCGDSNTVVLLSTPPWPMPLLAVENRPQNDGRVNVPLHKDIGVALAAHGHGLDRGLLRIGLVDDLHAGERDFQRSAEPRHALAVADQYGADKSPLMGVMDALEAFFRIGGGQHQPLVARRVASPGQECP